MGLASEHGWFDGKRVPVEADTRALRPGSPRLQPM
jgi:hypothetical protein